jgi:hypothetical protein
MLFARLAPLLLAAAALPAQVVDVGAGQFSLSLEKAVVTGVTQSFLELSFPATARSPVTVRLREVAFDGVTANGLPVYIQPVLRPQRLEAGRPTGLADLLRVRMYYRDIADLGPLRALLRSGHVEVQGQARATLELSLPARLLLFMNRARVDTRFRYQLPLEVKLPGVAAQAALEALDWSESAASPVREAWQSARARFSERRRTVEREWLPRLFVLRSSCTLRDRAGRTATLETVRCGLLLPDGELLTPGEILSPWNYDSEVVAALRRNEASIDPASLKIEARSVTQGTLFRGEAVSVAQPDSPASTRILIPRPAPLPARARLALRNSAGSFVVLRLNGAPAVDGITAAPAVDRPDLLDAAVFRSAAWDSSGQPELLFLPLRATGAGLALLDPLDRQAWGSPVIGPQGLVGVLADETAVLPYAALRAAIGR